MTFKNRKFLMLASAAAVVLPVTVVHAVSTNIDATAVFLNAITLTPTNMDFGTIEFSAAPGAPADVVTLATDGTLTGGGVFSPTAGTGTPGLVTITATDTYTLEIECDATATLSNGAGADIQLDNINFVDTLGGAGTCAGINGTADDTMVFNGVTNNTLTFGGRLDGSTVTAFVAGSYSTATGGDDIQVQVVYQ